MSRQAVILAGGRGERLRPLTDDTPKPLLVVGGKPIIRHTIDQLLHGGVGEIFVAVRYLPEKFHEALGGIAEVKIVEEVEPLGTAGILGYLGPSLTDDVIMVNGDVLCDPIYPLMLTCHQDSGSDVTVGTILYTWQVPYGVLQVQSANITGIQEKPVHTALVSAGVNIVSQKARRWVVSGQRMEMPDLIASAIYQGLNVWAYPIPSTWTDIGTISELQRVQQEYG